MKNNNFAKIAKATIISIIVALLFSIIIVAAIKIIVGNEISMAISLINKMSVEKTEGIQEKLMLSTEKNRLENYPTYGTQYGRIKINAVNINLPIYFGDTTEILKLGVGHYSGSYFPGEGGSIVYAAHNFAKYFGRLPKVKVGNIIEITTDYGNFKYKVYDTQVIHQSESDKLPIQDNEEILMLYTCYPVTGIGHKSHRFVVYAERMEG